MSDLFKNLFLKIFSPILISLNIISTPVQLPAKAQPIAITIEDKKDSLIIISNQAPTNKPVEVKPSKTTPIKKQKAEVEVKKEIAETIQPTQEIKKTEQPIIINQAPVILIPEIQNQNNSYLPPIINESQSPTQIPAPAPAPILFQISLNNNFKNPSYKAGNSGHHLASFLLTAATEAINGLQIKSISLQKNNNPDFDIRNLKIFSNGRQLANIKTDVQDSEDQIVFLLSSSMDMVSGGSYTLDVYGDISSSTNLGKYPHVIDLIDGEVFAWKNYQLEKIQWPSTVIKGQDITIINE